MEPNPVLMSTLSPDSGPDAKVYRFIRVRRVNGEPLILETSFYPRG